MPIVRGGSDVRSAIPTPPTQLPINIAQIAIGIPSPSAPGNISAPNETILAMSTIDATTPAIESLNASRPMVHILSRTGGTIVRFTLFEGAAPVLVARGARRAQ